jgi:hypothetical protein
MLVEQIKMVDSGFEGSWYTGTIAEMDKARYDVVYDEVCWRW